MKKLIYLFFISTIQSLFSATGYTPSAMNQQHLYNSIVTKLLELSTAPNSSDQVKELLEQAKKVGLIREILTHKTIEQKTLLHVFLTQKQIRSSSILINYSKKKELELTDENGKTAAHYVALINNPDLLTLLHKKHAQAFESEDSKKNTPLHCAVKEKCIDIIPLLIEYAPSTISIQNKQGNIPAHYCTPETISFFQPYPHLFAIKNKQERTIHDLLVESFAKQGLEESKETCVIL